MMGERRVPGLDAAAAGEIMVSSGSAICSVLGE